MNSEMNTMWDIKRIGGSGTSATVDVSSGSPTGLAGPSFIS
jgi:hypothetical protein